MKKLFGAAALSILFSITSCSAIKSIGNLSDLGKPQSSLSNTKWEVIDNANTNAKPYISFTPEEGMSGNAGCNKIFSQNVVIRSSNGDFDVKDIASTKMMCPSMDMNYERNFIEMIESADKYVIKKNTLELYKGNILLIKMQKSY